jgi:hypothetical protein
MSNKEHYRIIYYSPKGEIKVRHVNGLLTKANNIFNSFSAKPGKVTFEKKAPGTSTWEFIKSRG